MVKGFQDELTDMYRWSNKKEDEEAPTAGEIEDRIRGWLQEIGSETQELVIGQMDRNRRKGKKSCPECGEQVYWTRYEPRNYITSLGEMQIERAY
jgi:ArsR family metal-binding transcriptional regulator